MAAPVRNSCPDIDKGLVLLNQIDFLLSPINQNIKSYSIDDIEDAINSTLCIVSDIETHFEEVRAINSDLRSWAEEELERKENEIHMLREEMEDLEQELEEIRADYHV
jgi:chromosome segregation ATPase